MNNIAHSQQGHAYQWLKARGLSCAIIVASVIVAMIAGARPDTRIGDYLLTEAGRYLASNSDIVVVTISEETLAALPYRSPIDRAFLANVIEHIMSAKPKAIGIDILFDQPTEKTKDDLLRSVLATSRSKVVLASANQSDGLTDDQSRYLKEFTKGIKLGRATLLRDGADGIVRSWPPDGKHNTAGETAKLLAQAVAQVATGKQLSAADTRIIYYRPSVEQGASFPQYPAHQAKFLPKDWFTDKIVLIGSTLPNIDEHQTPFVTSQGVEAGTKYGVIVHAHMINQLLRGDRVLTRPFLLSPLIALAIAVAVAGTVTATRYALGPRLIATAAIILLSGLACLATFKAAGVELATASIVLSGALSAALFVTKRWYRDFTDRRFIQQAFSQYVSPEVVEEIVADPSRLQLGGEVREITYIFTDLQGFTSASEDLPPDSVASVLNAYLDGVCNLCVEHGATIDKIIGDAVVCLFGAPGQQPDQCLRAVKLARAIDAFSETFRTAHSTSDMKLGITRIGIHHGPAVIGNFGGSRFFDYTGIGDTVNTAARLEGANKYFGTRICVSDSVAQHCHGEEFRPIGNVQLKGRAATLTCFEPVLASHPAQADLNDYQAAYDLLSLDSDAAKDAFQALATKHPLDGLIQFHLNRLRSAEVGTKIVLQDK